jgi:hypothetical protein
VIKIEYFNNAITVYYHSGLNNDAKNNYEICARVEGITLPKKGHFGVSAATGGLADDHDVLSFLSYSLVDSRNQVCCFRKFCYFILKFHSGIFSQILHHQLMNKKNMMLNTSNFLKTWN